MSFQPCVVMTTTATQADAETIGLALLEKCLAACVQYEAVKSQYVWQGEVCTAEEVRVSIKSCMSLLPLLEDVVMRLHPYDCPEIVACPVQGSAAYLAWMEETLGACGFFSAS